MVTVFNFLLVCVISFLAGGIAGIIFVKIKEKKIRSKQIDSILKELRVFELNLSKNLALMDDAVYLRLKSHQEKLSESANIGTIADF